MLTGAPALSSQLAAWHTCDTATWDGGGGQGWGVAELQAGSSNSADRWLGESGEVLHLAEPVFSPRSGAVQLLPSQGRQDGQRLLSTCHHNF